MKRVLEKDVIRLKKFMAFGLLCGEFGTLAFLNYLMIFYFIQDGDFLSKCFLAIFIMIGGCMIGSLFGKLLHSERWILFFQHLYSVIFFLYFFGFLVFYTIYVIQQKVWSLFFLTIPFWMVGGWIFYQKLVKPFLAFFEGKHKN